EAVHGDVELPADEPPCERRVPFEHLRPWRPPVELAGHARPKGLRILRGVAAERVILQMGTRSERRGRLVLLPLLQEAVDWRSRDHHSKSNRAGPIVRGSL